MKQVIYLLAAGILLYSCDPQNKPEKDGAEQLKTKLLKLAGVAKMEQEFTFDYAVKNDSAVAMLSLVNTGGVINFNEADSAKGMLLNVFITPDGKQYSTRLKRAGGGFVQIAVQVIDGVEIPVFQYIPPNLGGGGSGGNGSSECINGDCTACMNICEINYRTQILPGLQKKADSLCKPVRYCFACPFGANNPCVYILVVVLPQNKNCSFVPNDPWRIATQKLSSTIMIKIVTARK